MIAYFDSEFAGDGLVTEQCVSCGILKRVKPLPSKEHTFVCNPCWQTTPEVVEVLPDPDDPTRLLVYTKKRLTVNTIEIKITCKVEEQPDENQRNGDDGGGCDDGDNTPGGAGSPEAGVDPPG